MSERIPHWWSFPGVADTPGGPLWCQSQSYPEVQQTKTRTGYRYRVAGVEYDTQPEAAAALRAIHAAEQEADEAREGPLSERTPSGHPAGPHTGDIWRHGKTGHFYHVLDIVRLEAANEPAVLYERADGTGPKWVRSVVDFFAEVAPGQCRFELVEQGRAAGGVVDG